MSRFVTIYDCTHCLVVAGRAGMVVSGKQQLLVRNEATGIDGDGVVLVQYVWYESLNILSTLSC